VAPTLDGSAVTSSLQANVLQLDNMVFSGSSGTPHQQYVEAVYQDVLDRVLDAGGLAHSSQLLDNGAAISSVADAIAHSDEYYGNFVIRPTYLKLLGRAADGTGVTYWTSQMDAGATVQQLEAALVSSPEFYNNADRRSITRHTRAETLGARPFGLLLCPPLPADRRCGMLVGMALTQTARSTVFRLRGGTAG
jgi:hypothetical protein